MDGGSTVQSYLVPSLPLSPNLVFPAVGTIDLAEEVWETCIQHNKIPFVGTSSKGGLLIDVNIVIVWL